MSEEEDKEEDEEEYFQGRGRGRGGGQGRGRGRGRGRGGGGVGGRRGRRGGDPDNSAVLTPPEAGVKFYFIIFYFIYLCFHI